MGKRILVIGQGGREHALVWKLAQSPLVERIYAAPGNPGMLDLARCIDIAADDIDRLADFALNAGIDLTVVGPEAPLMKGIVDRFRSLGLLIFGPTARAAQIEGSKVFAKHLFKQYSIPTANYEVFEDVYSARVYARQFTDVGKGVVIKADGLAAGKGVVVASDFEEADLAIEQIMKDRSFGDAGDRVVIEECLIGEELSFFAITDGEHYVPLMAAQDHKRIFDGDEGPNTGGMGAYTNPPVYTPELKSYIEKEVIEPTISAMKKEACPYTGVLYAGLMLTEQGPKVLEYNARFGDPETQVLMPMIKGDLLPVLEASARGDLAGLKLDIEEGSCVGVVLASGGYPGDYEKGFYIKGLDQLEPNTMVFHAGTALKDGNLVTNGGRVLSVVCRGKDIDDAVQKVYAEIDKIHFEGMHYRKDIAHRAR